MQDSQGKDNRGDTARPICIIGANGKTGSECVGACLARGIPVVATTRGGVYTGNYANTSSELLIGNAICDVTLPNTITDAIKGSRAVIFAASASKAGGTPAAVDNLGLVNVAKACIDQKIPHLVIVSSGAVTKPESPVYKFLNLFGNIMEEKIKGEDRVRNMYQKELSQGTSTTGIGTTTYTILRPGGLTEESVRGVQALELNQGDTKSGRISRADVAALCVEVTKYPAITGGTTFECYDADTGKPLQTVGISNLFKQKNNMNPGQKGASSNVDVYMSGYEQRGSTWEELFTGLSKDVDVNEKIIS
jgi:Nucleoside-diphosphate-sugar epimerases